jgi:hypothetical protein
MWMNYIIIVIMQTYGRTGSLNGKETARRAQAESERQVSGRRAGFLRRPPSTGISVVLLYTHERYK